MRKMLDMLQIQDCAKNGRYYFSKHGDQERQNDNLTIAEVEEAIAGARIIECYEDTGR